MRGDSTTRFDLRYSALRSSNNPPHGPVKATSLCSGENEPWRGGQAEHGLRPGNGDPVTRETVVRRRGVDVAPEPLEIGAVEQPATATLLVQRVDRLARTLRGE